MSTITTAEFTELTTKDNDYIHGPYGLSKNVQVVTKGMHVVSDLVKNLAQRELSKLLKDIK